MSGASQSELERAREPRALEAKPEIAWLAAIALATIAVHLMTGGRYGFHRDELATLDDARRLSWGYVAYPPVTPFFGRMSLILFGTSLRGFRFFAAVAQAAGVFLTGLMAREMGGRRWAQLLAAMAAVPFCLAAGALMQYVSFDYVSWVATAYFLVRMLKSGDARWCLAAGAAIGFGLESKYTMIFFVAGILAGLILTDARRYLRSGWVWAGAALAFVIFLPNFVWEARRGFVTLDFLRNIHARDIRIGRTANFLPDQLKGTFFSLPLWAAGLYACFFLPGYRRFRMLAWMWIVPLAIFIAAKGRGYYFAPAYPMLYAAGAVRVEEWLKERRSAMARWTGCAIWGLPLIAILLVIALWLPTAPQGTRWWRLAARQQADYRDEVGWPEFVETVAKIRDTLPAAERGRMAILTANYGEAGAIDLFGPRYGLPQAISGGNSYWAKGYGKLAPETVIVTGFSAAWAERNFASCLAAARVWNYYGVQNEETGDHPYIFVCRGLRQPWPRFWAHFRYFG